MRSRKGFFQLLQLVTSECRPIASLFPFGSEFVRFRVTSVTLIGGDANSRCTRGTRFDSRIRWRHLFWNAHYVIRGDSRFINNRWDWFWKKINICYNLNNSYEKILQAKRDLVVSNFVKGVKKLKEVQELKFTLCKFVTYKQTSRKFVTYLRLSH